MPSCRKCGAQWPHGYATCPNDGLPLVADHAVSGMAAVAAAPVPISDELPHGFIVGEYAIERKLGEGGMGAVYGARHPLIGKRVAIKVISRDLSASTSAVERFVLEAQAVNQIGNQNIVDIFSFGRLDDGRSYFVMEWLQGESLRERMQRLPLAPSEAIDFLETMVKALMAAHEAGIIHRDLKPDNIFLVAQRGDKPVVKLLDFGLAKLSGPGDTRHERTRTGMVMGTPLYLSPEQARGDKVDGATDIYSLGAVAFEMFVGEVPFNADSAVEIMAQHISRPLTPPTAKRPGLPPAVDELVLGMMAKQAHQRPSLAEIHSRLLALRPMFVGMTGPTANTVYQAATPMHPSGTQPQAWGQQPNPSWQPQPGSATTAPHGQVGQSSHPQPPPPRKSRVALFAILGLVVAGGVAA
ncbi:MAG: protein kinase, partial [Deltaproteobacteria bacterium]|nr:protein kinase [Deltaproteobacteria bacterium]